MSKREDNIHKRKDGRWEGRIKVGSYPNGKTKYRSLYGTSYKEVKEKMASYGDGAISISLLGPVRHWKNYSFCGFKTAR